MQSLEILKVAVEEGVFIVPFDFTRDDAGPELFHVIDFMRYGFTRTAVYTSFNDEVHFCPPNGCKPFSQTLGSFRLAAAAANNLLDWYRQATDDILQLFYRIREVHAENCMGMRMYFNLITTI